jgi:hypothetical protein
LQKKKHIHTNKQHKKKGMQGEMNASVPNTKKTQATNKQAHKNKEGVGR